MNHDERLNQLPVGAGSAIAVWLAIQLLSLIASTARFTLWARQSPVTERYALAMLVAVQIGAASLLFPILLKTTTTLWITIATAFPMGNLAALLASAEAWTWLRSEIYVACWLIGLHAFVRQLRTPRSEIIASAAIAMISLGFPILLYLRADFGNAGPWPMFAGGPLAGGISLSLPAGGDWTSWIFIVAMGLLALATAATAKARTKMRTKLSPISRELP